MWIVIYLIDKLGMFIMVFYDCSWGFSWKWLIKKIEEISVVFLLIVIEMVKY